MLHREINAALRKEIKTAFLSTAKRGKQRNEDRKKEIASLQAITGANSKILTRIEAKCTEIEDALEDNAMCDDINILKKKAKITESNFNEINAALRDEIKTAFSITAKHVKSAIKKADNNTDTIEKCMASIKEQFDASLDNQESLLTAVEVLNKEGVACYESVSKIQEDIVSLKATVYPKKIAVGDKPQAAIKTYTIEELASEVMKQLDD